MLRIARRLDAFADGLEAGRRADRMRQTQKLILADLECSNLGYRLLVHRTFADKSVHPSTMTKGSSVVWMLHQRTMPSESECRALAIDLRRIEPLLPKSPAGKRRRAVRLLERNVAMGAIREDSESEREKIHDLRSFGRFEEWRARKWVYVDLNR